MTGTTRIIVRDNDNSIMAILVRLINKRGNIV